MGYDVSGIVILDVPNSSELARLAPCGEVWRRRRDGVWYLPSRAAEGDLPRELAVFGRVLTVA